MFEETTTKNDVSLLHTYATEDDSFGIYMY